jgi:HAD superfamily hydrolase (TIGR01509 family)
VEPRLVIFDCDGVLVDSEPISNAVLARALTEAGLPTTPAQAIAAYKGRIMSDVVGLAQAQLGRPLPDGFVAAFEADREREFMAGLEPIPGAADTVRALTEAGVRVAVASQGKLSKTELTLGVTGLRALFGSEALFSAYAVTRGKPYPDLYRHVAERMGATSDLCVVVEDTVIGVTAGVAAGMRVLGYAPDDDGEALRAAGGEPITALEDVLGVVGLD